MSERTNSGALSVGDVVVLKSGGPPMTVTGRSADGYVDTNWMGHGETETHHECFPVEALRRARWFER